MLIHLGYWYSNFYAKGCSCKYWTCANWWVYYSLSFTENDVPNERNAIVYELKVSCKKCSPRLTVKSDQLMWLPEGSQLHKETSSQSAEPKTYTNFGGCQLEVSKKPLGVKYKDIILSKLGPGQVMIIRGKDKGEMGIIKRVIRSQNRIIIEGKNLVKKYIKQGQGRREGGIFSIEAPLHVSNVQVLDPVTGNCTWERWVVLS